MSRTSPASDFRAALVKALGTTDDRLLADLLVIVEDALADDDPRDRPVRAALKEQARRLRAAIYGAAAS